MSVVFAVEGETRSTVRICPTGYRRTALNFSESSAMELCSLLNLPKGHSGTIHTEELPALIEEIMTVGVTETRLRQAIKAKLKVGPEDIADYKTDLPSEWFDQTPEEMALSAKEHLILRRLNALVDLMVDARGQKKGLVWFPL